MPYIPVVTELLLAKAAIAIKGLLMAKGAAATAGAHFVAQQAGQQALQALVAGITQYHLAVVPALKAAVVTGATVLTIGGVAYTVAEATSYIIAKMRGEGYTDAEIRKYFRDNYDLDVL